MVAHEDEEVVEVALVDEVLAPGGDNLDDEERARLHESLRRGLAEMEADETIDASIALAELRAQG